MENVWTVPCVDSDKIAPEHSNAKMGEPVTEMGLALVPMDILDSDVLNLAQLDPLVQIVTKIAHKEHTATIAKNVVSVI